MSCLATERPRQRTTKPPVGAPRIGARVEARIDYTGTVERYLFNNLTGRTEVEVRLARYPHITVRLPFGSELHQLAIAELPSDQPGTIGDDAAD